MKKQNGFFIYELPVWVVIALAIYILVKLAFPGWPSERYEYWYFVILYVAIFGISLYQYWFSVEVEANTSIVMQNSVTGSLSPKWPGFNWKSLFDYIKYTVDTQKHLSTKESGDWDAEDDKMKGTWKVLWRVNIKNNRDGNMVKYVQTTEANIESAIKLIANQKITDYCNGKPSDEIKKEREKILEKSAFGKICDEYGIEILDCGMEDMDYSDASEEAREAVRAAQAFQKAVDSLMDKKNPNHCTSVEEARKIVKAKMLGGNYQEIEINNPTKVPIVVSPQKRRNEK